MNLTYRNSRLTLLDRYNSASGIQPSIEFPSPDILALTGVVVDWIQDTSTPMPTHFTSFSEHVRILRDWWSFAKAGDKTFESVRFKTFAATMTATSAADDDDHDHAGPADKPDFERWKALLSQLLEGSFVEADLTSSGLMFRHLTAVLKRRLFRTVSGRLGVGPYRLRRRDPVWVFGGGPTPFVLRRSRKYWRARHEYVLIGHCYLHGVMDGEAVSNASKLRRCHLT